MDRWARFRLGIRLLAVVDWLLGTHLVGRVTDRWRREILTMQSEISALQERLEDLGAARGAMLRQLCLSYLQVRAIHSPDDWLHFDPRNPDEETAIDVLTRALVAPHWARWRMTPLPGTADGYTYDLIPDWEALHKDALRQPGVFPERVVDWLAEQKEPIKRKA
jgi:hypothetical protein